MNQLKGGALLSYVSIFLTNVVGLLLTPFIIRTLGSAEYGLYTMIGALVGYLSVLDFGLNNTVVRFVAKYKAENDKKKEENFLAHAFLMYFCISFLVIIGGGLLYYNLEGIYQNSLDANQMYKAKLMLLILIFNLAISLPAGAFGGICYGYEKFILPQVVDIFKYIIRSAVIVFILLYGGDSISLVILDTVFNLIVYGIDAYIVFKLLNVRIKLHKLNKTIFYNTLSFSLWLFVFALVHQLRWQFGQLILGIYFSTSVVAVYAVGSTLGNYYGAFSSAISSVFLPKAIKMTVENKSAKELTDTFIRISRIILFVLLFILGAFIIVGKTFVFYWVGDEYYMAYYFALLIMFGLTPTLSQGFANNILEAKNLMAYRGKIILTLTVLGVIASFLVVQKYGALAMIIATIAFILLERIIMIPYYIKKVDLDMKRYYKEIAPLFLSIFIALAIFEATEIIYPNKNILIAVFNITVFTSVYFIFCKRIMTQYEKNLFTETLSSVPILKSFIK